MFQAPIIAVLDAAAQKHDIPALQAACSPDLLKRSPGAFSFLKNGGSYAVGRFGWHVYRLDEIGGGTAAVFSTPLTVEDLGEQVFRWENGKLTKVLPEDDRQGVRLLRNDITARFDLANKKAFFQDSVRFMAEEHRPSFRLRLGTQYRVSSIQDDQGRPVAFTQAGGTVSVAEPAHRRLFTYRLKYSGVDDLYQYAGYVSPEEILLGDDYWYPTVGRNAAPYSLTAYTPRGWQVIGQGIRERQRQLPDSTETHYRMDIPAVFYSFSAAPFKTATDRLNGLTLGTWSKNLPESAMHVQNRLQADVLEFYSKTFSPYPFRTWGTVASDPYGEGALEAYSYATYGAGGDWPEEDAHEPSHTWWGGILPNNYLHSQWNESFADFSQEFFQRERPLGNREERRRAFVGNIQPTEAMNLAPVSQGSPDLGPGAGTLGYGKGAVVLAMLEHEIGTPALLHAMHLWLAHHQYETLEEWPGFERAVRRATGRDYEWFFNQWLNRNGWADFEVDNVKFARGSGAGGVVTGRVQFKGAPFRLKVEVLLQYRDGARELRTLRVKGSTNFALSVSRKPAIVSVDPWWRLLRTHHEDEEPLSIKSELGEFKRYVDPSHKDWMTHLKEGSVITELPSNLDGVFLVGSPETTPAMAPLCRQAGFQVHGHELVYHGTTVDLSHGGALAILDLPNGGRCAIGLGKTLARPNTGNARTCVVDGYGRFLRGWTEPKTSGWMTFRIP